MKLDKIFSDKSMDLVVRWKGNEIFVFIKMKHEFQSVTVECRPRSPERLPVLVTAR